MRWILLLAFLFTTQVALGQSTLVSVDFEDEELGTVLRSLAKQMNRELLLDPAVEGEVTLRLTNVSFDSVLSWVLRPKYDYGLFEEGTEAVLVVAKPGHLGHLLFGVKTDWPRIPRDAIKMEYKLELTPATTTKVVTVLRREHVRVEFTDYPNSSRISARGSREEILQIGAELSLLLHREDTVATAVKQDVQVYLNVHNADPVELLDGLKRLLPDVEFHYDSHHRRISAFGSPSYLVSLPGLFELLDGPDSPILQERWFLFCAEPSYYQLDE